MSPSIYTAIRRFAVFIISSFGFALIALGCSSQPASTSPVPVTASEISQPAFEVFAVRHAEKTADKDDPALTSAGQARAELLADMLRDAGITHIHSTDTKRTRDTAAPLAKRLGLDVQLYNGRQLENFAANIGKNGGRHLVVGHSNTTDHLVELLGGQGGAPIVEAGEYDRLYYVTIGIDGRAETSLMRFGQKFEAGGE